ncbi:unnamed protein product [Albugo candida]|uniref:Uncharacterized protein n=1 Tax=Albugo candida TaxID=65357 RepID=A0A024GH70_9STRA|nr:unnamed protein product [Albugo candida]|eukprot:CCI46109.1 unnamed protein product [Albugo candida]
MYEKLVSNDRTDTVLARLGEAGVKTVTAFSSSYDDRFPSSLDGIITRKEFAICMQSINDTVAEYFPCVPCYAIGYFCCMTTFGLSLCCQEPCTRDLEVNLHRVLRQVSNREVFLYRGIYWRFRRACYLVQYNGIWISCYSKFLLEFTVLNHCIPINQNMRNHCIIGIAAIVLVTLSNNGGCHDIDDQVFRQTASDPAVWLDEGVMAKGEFHDWEEQKTFCFHNNATLRIRLDPLDRYQNIAFMFIMSTAHPLQ